MKTEPFPEALRKLVRSGRLVPVVGRDLGGASTGEALESILGLLAGFGCPAILSLTALPEAATFLTGLGWQVKERSSAGYRPDMRMLIMLAPDEAEAGAGTSQTWWADLAYDQPFLWECALAFAAREPLVVIGCDPEDIVTRATISSLRPSAHFRTGGWVVWHSPVDPEIELQLRDAGFRLVPMTASQLITNLQATKADDYFRDDVSLAPLVEANKSPYKLLNYYEAGDRALFSGRDQEIENLANLISAYPLIIVTGASGSGKTSLLKAGIVSHFARNPPYECYYVRFRDDPWRSLEAGLGPTATEAESQSLDDGDRTFNALVSASAERDILPVVIIDQFEELFIRFPPLIQSRFWDLIRRCLTSSEIPVRFVMVIREDYLGKLAAMRQQYPALLQNTFYVPPLSRSKALDAILDPAKKVGVRFDEGVARRIVDELQRRQTVSAPELQIVCNALFEARSGGEINDDTYRRLGGCQKILATFLKSELSRRGTRFLSRAEAVLKGLITSERTKENLPAAAIAMRAKLDLDSTREVLRTLRDECRFVRNLPGEEDIFELSHDYLAEEITSWMSPGERDQRAAHDLLDRELRAWTQFGSIRLGPDRLSYFAQSLDDELLSDDGLLYLLLSSVRYLASVDRWTDCVKAAPVESRRRISRKLFDLFESTDLATRREAAELIGILEPSCILDELSSNRRSSKKAAIEIAGGLGLSSAIEPLFEIMLDEHHDMESRVLACAALGEIAQQAPELLDRLLSIARESPDLQLRDAVIAGLGHASGQIPVYDLIADAIASDLPTTRRAGVAAIREGQAAALLELLLTADRYESLEEEVKTEIWAAIARSREDESSETVARVAKSLKREDLLRFSPDKWFRHWLYRVLIHEFCERWPADCRTVPSPECAALIETCNYSIHWMRRAVQSGCGNAVILHLQHRSDVPALGAYLRELVLSGERELRIMAFRVIWSTTRPKEMEGSLKQFLSASRMRGFLQSQDTRERYWACLVTGFLGHLENVEILRRMSFDAGFSDPHDSAIGFEVGDAARFVLDALSPGSAIWQKPWQRSFRDDGPPA